LIGEILGHTAFDDKKRMKEIIREMKSRLEMVVFSRGHIAAGNHLLSYFSSAGKFNEITKGLDFYRFIASLEKEFDKSADKIIESLKKVSRAVFNKNNLLISFTAEEKDYKSFKDNMGRILEELGSESLSYNEYKFDLTPENEGLLTQANVQYVAKGYNFFELGYKYTGKLLVLKTIIGLDYLWNEVRVQGGAYGAFGRFDRSGNMFAVSYRDPNLKETMNIYDKMYEYIGSFNPDNREMTKYIIGTISEIDFPMTPSMKGDRAAANYICRISSEDVQRERDEVLSTKPEDIRAFADMAKDLMKQNYVCVIGNESKIKENKEVFNKLVKLFE
jgi:Zn-dependent M16 (insulinase) family peptidase